jgi:hypothetical protein
MTKQTEFANSLVGSSAGIRISRLRTLTIAATLAIGAVSSFGQQPQATPSEKAIPAAEKKAPAPPVEKIVGNYTMHSNVELGGVISQWDGSDAMWATMVNEGTGMRLLNQSLEMHTVNPSKTPFFDTLSTASFGYGGEPNNVSYLKMSKGKFYDFMGGFRRDRNYYDYNLMPNSLLSTATPATPVLVPQPSSLHIFNTVRRNTDVLFTLFPVSRFSFRAGYNQNTHEGPTLSTLHGGGDVQLSQWFRNGLGTYTGGVDFRLAKRTTLSYDQFVAFYRGDTSFQLAPTPFTLSDGTPVSLGVNVLTGPTVTCGTGANKTQNVINGIANPFCSSTTTENQVAPTRTSFPTEQFRFASNYWDKVSMNGRITYSGGVSNVNSFNQTFIGIGRASSCPPNTPSCVLRQEVETGAGPNGQFAHNKRINVNADYGIEAELSKYLSVSDAFHYWDFRVPGSSAYSETVLTGATATTSNFTPLTSPSLTTVTTPSTVTNFLNQKITGNTILGIATVTPQVKISGGWRFDNRNITDPGDDLTWHQNGLLIGAVVTPSQAFRFNVNLDTLNWKSANADTPTNTYTREAPDKVYHVRARALVKPAKWINFAVTANDFQGKNDDPLVNLLQHSHDFSFATQIIPTEKFSVDLYYAHDDVFSETDLCYIFVPTATYPLPPGAVGSEGTCLQTANNPGGTLPTQPASSQLYLGNGRYDAPVNFFSGAISWAPSKYFVYNGGARFTDTNGTAELLNPLMVPGALQSKVVSPFSDLQINIAPQWAWHGNWVHHGYDEGGGPGPAPRTFHGDVITLGVKYAF